MSTKGPPMETHAHFGLGSLFALVSRRTKTPVQSGAVDVVERSSDDSNEATPHVPSRASGIA